jgi:hypothetical protein
MKSLALLTSEICNELGCGPGQNRSWKATRLVSQDRPVASTQALDLLRSPALHLAEGWVLAVNIPRPLRLPDDQPRLAEVQWIEAAEVVSADGTESWHFRDLGQGQCLVTHFTEAPEADAVLVEASLLGSDGIAQLRYHVGHRLQVIGLHQELRPVAARFVGFKE